MLVSDVTIFDNYQFILIWLYFYWSFKKQIFLLTFNSVVEDISLTDVFVTIRFEIEVRSTY